MHCVRSIWGSYGYAFRGNAIAGTPAEHLNQISGDRLMRSLKRDVLLFESIYVVPVELNTVLNKLSETNRDTLLMLKDKSIITLYDDVFPPQECTGDTFRFVGRPLQRTAEMYWRFFQVVQSSLIKMSVNSKRTYYCDDEDLVRIRQSVLDYMYGIGVKEACDMYFDIGQLVHDFQARFHAEHLQTAYGINVIPVLDKSEPTSHFIKPFIQDFGKENGDTLPSSSQENLECNIIKVCLEMIPVPDSSAPWETILAYRESDDVRRNYLALRRWMKKAATEFTGFRELKEEIEYLILERESHLRLYELKINYGAIETVLMIGSEVIENIARIKLSSAVKALFSLSRRNIQLLEAEHSAPGKEIAYISDARRLLCNPKAF